MALSVFEYSTKITLREYIRDEDVCSTLWVHYKGDTARASSILKLIVGGVFKEVVKRHKLGRVHGRITLDNIVFFDSNLSSPFLIGWNGVGSVDGDFQAIYSMLLAIFAETKGAYLAYDIETQHFLEMLNNSNRDMVYLKNHFWFMTPVRRSRFFTETFQNTHRFFMDMEIFSDQDKNIKEIPHSLTSVVTDEYSPLLCVYNQTMLDGLGVRGEALEFGYRTIDSIMWIRHYYQHGVEAMAKLEIPVSSADLETEMFHYYPTLMEEVYDKLCYFGLLQNCF